MVETERRATKAIRAKEAAAESGDGILVIDVFVGVIGVGVKSRCRKRGLMMMNAKGERETDSHRLQPMARSVLGLSSTSQARF